MKIPNLLSKAASNLYIYTHSYTRHQYAHLNKSLDFYVHASRAVISNLKKESLTSNKLLSDRMFKGQNHVAYTLIYIFVKLRPQRQSRKIKNLTQI